MVSSTGYPPADDRRYSSNRGVPPYTTPYTDRRQSTYSHHDSRSSIMSDRDGDDEPATQRKRIAVACGRCRKRKIRCTGDSGNGQPCLNCKNAGYAPCRFLRVASQEAPMKNDTFSYNLEVARNFHARASSMTPGIPASMTTYPPEAMSIPGSEALSYRSGSAYAYHGGRYYPVSTWTGGYPEDGQIDYSVYQPSYQQPVQEPGYMMGYRMAPQAAATSAPARPASSSSVYVDSEPNYGYHSGNAAMTSMMQRPTPSADSGSYAFQTTGAGMASTMAGTMASTVAGTVAGTVASGDRLLPPTPASRPLTSSGQPSYRTESVSSASAYSRTSQSSNGGSPAPLSDATTAYSSFENSPMTSYPAAATVSSQMARAGDTGSTAAPPSADDSLRLTGTDMTYRYTDTTRRYPTSSYAGTMAQPYLSHGHGQHSSSYMVSGDDHERKSDLMRA